MTLRPLLLAITAASTLMLATAAQAHDPSLHADMPTQKEKPTTCEQLVDTQRYSNDLADPDVKALKVRCDVTKKSKPVAGEKSASGTK